MTSSLNSAMALDDSFMRSRSCWWRRCSEVDGLPESPVDLGEFVLCCAQADLEAFDFAEPALAFGFANASDEVVANLDQSIALCRVWPQQCTTDTSVFVDTGCSERASAGADGDLASCEVSEELGPVVVGGYALFLARPQRSTACEECQVGLDRLLGVDGLVSHGDVDVAVTGDHLRDVRRQPVQNGFGDEHSAEVMRR